ncbi:LCP family protein [Schaalia sp. ZJ1691]|uniref:LCP family protein n=1 Tax=Schaalia sp. ZJ1691 TaxID=2709404 RepID=UPI0013ED9541|nr:LCP family protein [Schaalia sp. ZJ1691]
MTNPPSFTPDPSRRRPSHREVRRTSRGSDDCRPLSGDEDERTPASDSSNGASERQWRISRGDDSRGRPLRQSIMPPDHRSGAAPEGASSPLVRGSDSAGNYPRENAQPRPAAMPPAYAPQARRAPSYRASTQYPDSHDYQGRGASQGVGGPSGSRWQSPRQQPGATAPRTAESSHLRPGVTQAPRRRPKRSWRSVTVKILLFFLVVLLAWVSFLLWDANTNLGRTTALSGAPDSPGTTYLLAGSDSRADGAVQDGFEGGERSDSIMLINVAPNGQAVAVSLPRDTLARIPDYGEDKLNASYAYGGSELLVKTVEALTGLTVDHYVQVGMGGVSSLVDAVGGVNLCYDADVDDAYSGLVWTAGCHDVDGKTALAFSRMRYSDPQGDIGRTNRQRQVISQVISQALSPSTLVNPAKTLTVERAGSSAFTVDNKSNVFDVAQLVLALRKASHNQLTGVPPIASLSYITDAGASAVLLQEQTAPAFFNKVRSGTLTPTDLNQIAP